MDLAKILAPHRERAQEPRVRSFQEALTEISDEERTASFIASDETVDRYGDVVSVKGWDLTNFRRNPIFLWMHSQFQPIGKVKKIGVEGDKLVATVRFFDPGDSKVADDLWRLVKKRLLRAVSVGFTVKSDDDIEPIRDDNERVTGFRFLRQELLELSLVSVPANPNALQLARSCPGIPIELLNQALPLDALVQQKQVEARQAWARTRLAGLIASAPR
jgi:HK97 family phage prohead protease